MSLIRLRYGANVSNTTFHATVKLRILKQSEYIKIILVNSKLQNNWVPGDPLPIVLVTKMCPKCDRHGTSLHFLCDGLSLEVFQLPLSEWFQENLKSRVQPKNTTCSMSMGCLGGLYYFGSHGYLGTHLCSVRKSTPLRDASIKL